jgi:Ferredoxin-dependent bilin reductase
VSPGLGFVALVRASERRLVRELGLEPYPLEPELARLDGDFRSQPATLVARAYTGPGLRYARFVELESQGLEIGNVVLFPSAELPLPVLGVDLVEVGRETAVVVADLSPMTDEAGVRGQQHAVLARHRAQGTPLAAAGELPAWAAEWFSSLAVSARVSAEQAPAAVGTVNAFVSAFIELAQGALPDPTAAACRSSRQEAYSAAHREHDRGLLLLRRIFEPALADRFLREVLFPERLPA